MIHRHRWHLLGAQVQTFTSGDITDVLYLCAACKRTRELRLRGAWNITTLIGTRP